ncbi:MAG: hypothetical protein EHM58_06325 [Ignavibacteriae bacterium]|nr:MAG: hypothetical protein EHM58_06325 [Ignavibacteriota bacterium]
MKKLYILLFILSLVLISCNDVPTGTSTNRPPDTFLSLFPDSTISPQKTRVKITWWGDDPDGLITGFNISFDSLNWSYTTGNDSTFLLAINGNDSTFRFWVAAVDDKGLADPTPASNLFPVYNSPPSVKFNTGTELPDTTFTVATFIWTGTDPDGNSTIKKYHWALNDTSNWHSLNGSVSSITLRQSDGLIINQNNKFYLKAEDIAGTFSPVISMPDSNKTWFVKEPTGRVLIIDDYSIIADNGTAAAFYETALDTVLHSILDIKVGNGANIPKVRNPMFVETMKLFRVVIWYASRGNLASDNANFVLAQETLPYYMASGGKVFFSTGFPNFLNDSVHVEDFVPVDSVTSYSSGLIDIGTEAIVVDNNYPVLQTGDMFSPDKIRGVYPKAGTNIIYRFPVTPPYSQQNLVICLKNTSSNPNIVFMSVPLHRMNNLGNAQIFLKKVIYSDFGL